MQIHDEAVRYKEELLQKSGWKWLGGYQLDFIKNVPVMVAVLGNSRKSGADMLMEETACAWRDACGAAIQNIMLTASSLALSSLWFTMFNRKALSDILPDREEGGEPLALVFLGKAAGKHVCSPRIELEKKVTYL